MVAPVEALVAIPESLSDVEAAPLLCAGITTYNALRHSGALPGDLVAVQGIGGLGHLGIQFANKFGYKVAAIGRGPENAALAKKLGASVYIDSKATNAAEALQKLGGAQVILATAPSSKAMSELIDGLGPNGKLMVVGAAFDPIEVTPLQLITGSRTIQGWASGTPADSEDTLRFAELTGVRPMIETYPLEKAAEAYARMMSGKARVPRRSDDVNCTGRCDQLGFRGPRRRQRPWNTRLSIAPSQIDGLSIFYREAGPKDAPTHSPAARTALVIANVRAALRPALRSLSPGRARLPWLRTQRLAGPEEIRVHVRSLSPRS